MDSYRVYGWKVASALPLSGLPVWDGPARPDDIVIRLGAVPALANAKCANSLLQIADDGCCRFEIAAVAAYGVDAKGETVTIEPHMAEDASDIRVFLFGTVLAILCFKHGLVPLHGSCVRFGDKAVAFCGISGAGKSTLAALLHKRGMPILADDVTVLDSSGAVPLVYPALPRLKLWRDIIDGCALSPDGLQRVRAALDKYYLPVDPVAPTPVPLTHVYYLMDARQPQFECQERLSGVEHFQTLDDAIYRRHIGYQLLTQPQMFALLSRVAGPLSSARLHRVVALARAEELADQLVAQEGVL